MTDALPNTTPAPAPPFRARRHRLRRVGCLAGLLIWGVVMVSPCFLVVLATQGQISVSLGSAPNQEARIWLINEARVRGIALSWPSLHQVQADRALCVQTDTRFLLWAGSGDPATFCDCYSRQGANAGWTLTATRSGGC